MKIKHCSFKKFYLVEEYNRGTMLFGKANFSQQQHRTRLYSESRATSVQKSRYSALFTNVLRLP